MAERQGYNTVRLLRGYKGLNAGELGGFATREAQLLLSKNWAQSPKAKYPPDGSEAPAPPAHAGDPIPSLVDETAVVDEASSAEDPTAEAVPARPQRGRGRGRGAPEETA